MDKGEKAEFRGVGTNLVKSLQEFHNDRKMDLYPMNTTTRFYRKLGFKSPCFYECHMHWTPKNLNK